MGYAPDIHVAIYQVLDQARTARVVPPGAKARIHSVIDDLRAGSAPASLVKQAERISIALHNLDWALHAGNAEQALELQGTLKNIAGEWLDHRIARPSQSVER